MQYYRMEPDEYWTNKRIEPLSGNPLCLLDCRCTVSAATPNELIQWFPWAFGLNDMVWSVWCGFWPLYTCSISHPWARWWWRCRRSRSSSQSTWASCRWRRTPRSWAVGTSSTWMQGWSLNIFLKFGQDWEHYKLIQGYKITVHTVWFITDTLYETAYNFCEIINHTEWNAWCIEDQHTRKCLRGKTMAWKRSKLTARVTHTDPTLQWKKRKTLLVKSRSAN